jgi:hypothetical protein
MIKPSDTFTAGTGHSAFRFAQFPPHLKLIAEFVRFSHAALSQSLRDYQETHPPALRLSLRLRCRRLLFSSSALSKEHQTWSSSTVGAVGDDCTQAATTALRVREADFTTAVAVATSTIAESIGRHNATQAPHLRRFSTVTFLSSVYK